MTARHLAPTVALLLVALAPGTAGAAEVTVTVGDSFFEPGTVEIEAGTTVRWVQDGGAPHSVTADDGSFDSHPACTSVPESCMQDGDTYSRTFAQPGIVPYYCKIHGGPGGNGMAGVVRIVDETGVVPTTVKTLSATAGNGLISVGGTAALGEQAPVIVGTDGVGDAAGGPAATALGLDMDKLLISRPSSSSSSLAFTIKLGGLATGGIPETILYNWDINVDGGAPGGGGSWSIKTVRSRPSSFGNMDPYAGVFTCVQGTSGPSCTERTRLSDVVYDQAKSEIRLGIPLAAIDAKPGSRIEAWARLTNPFWIGIATPLGQTVPNAFDSGTHVEYVVPDAAVRLGIAPAGRAISYSTAGTISAAGAFSGSLPSPSTPGTYEVGVQVCFGTNCGTSSVPVTI